MAAINKKCMVCLYDYDEVGRRPLILSCGHSYCQSCLVRLRSTRNTKCPYCRKSWQNTPIDELPLCYQLMPEETLPDSTLCHQHKTCQLIFWCKDCQVTGCKLCLSTNHKLCDWILVEDAPIMLKTVLQETVEKTKQINLKNHLEVRSAIVETNDTLHALKELMHTLKIVECNLEKYKTDMSAVECEIRCNLNLIGDKQFDSNTIDETISLTVMQTKINQAASLQSQYVWPIKPTFHELEKVVSDFQAKSEELIPDGEWKIRNHRMAKAATVLLKRSEVNPTQVTVIVTKNWAPKSSILMELLPLIASRKCDVRLRFMDTFLEPTEQTAEVDNQRLNAFNSLDRRCYLKEFWGHLDRHSVKKLSNYSVMEIKGVAILQPADLNNVCDVEWWTFSYVADKERELHLHIPKTWTVDNTTQLNQKVLEDYSLHLHIPCIRELDINSTNGLIQKWLKRATIKRQRALYLPDSELSPESVSTSLLNMVYGLHSEYARPIFTKVYIESDRVQLTCRSALKWMYTAKGIDLIWTDE